jgi:lysophospholipase L1-like esterase
MLIKPKRTLLRPTRRKLITGAAAFGAVSALGVPPANAVAVPANAKILFIGDSTVAGYGATAGGDTGNAISLSWPYQLAGLLTSRPTPNTISSAVGNHGGLSVSTFDTRVAVDGQFTAGWPFYVVNSLSTGTFTPTDTCTKIAFYYAAASGVSSFTVSVNGSVVGTVNPSGPTAVGIFQYTHGSAITSVVVTSLGSAGTEGAIYIQAFRCYSATPRLEIINAGWGDSRVAHWIQAVNGWDALYFIDAIAPDLSIIDLTINDWNSATDLTTYSSNLQTLITRCKLTGNVILMTGNPSNTGAAQSSYVAAVASLATSNSVPLIDIWTLWGSWASANSNGWMFDALHPNAAGYAQIASTVLPYITVNSSGAKVMSSVIN